MQVSRTGCVQVLLLLLLLQLLLLQLQQAAATKWFLFGRPQGSAADSCNRSGEEIHLEAQWFEQPLDHFDPILQAEGRKWKQRYFELLHQDPQQQQQQQQQQQGNQLPRPMFVYIGGEAAIAPTDITGGHLGCLRISFAADVFAVEHRFYGESKPNANSEPETLRALTVQQALADLAAFIEAKRRERAKAQKVSPSHIPVVVFGCSYPGSLAAFARLKYPFLISGAISSSSPLQAKESFFAFDAAVKAGLPPRCAAAAAAGLAALSSRMQDTTLAEQELHRFGCEDVPIQTNTEKTAFVYSVVDAVAEAVQYNRPTERPLVESLCSSLGFVAADVPPDSSSSSNSSSSSSSSSSRIKPKMSSAHVVEYEEEEEREKKEKKEAGVVFREETRDRDRDRDRDREEHLLQGLAKYFKESYSRKQTNCRSLNMLAATDTRLDNSVLSNTRLWMWQSCSQFGFWQVASPGSIRPPSINVQFHLDVCNKLFPLPQGEFKDKGIKETNEWAGGRHLGGFNAASNIHFTNGSADPWARLSLLFVDKQTEDQQHISSFVIQGGSHCTDFYSPAASDSPSLINAREEIRKAVAGFIDRHRAAISSSSSSSSSSRESGAAEGTDTAEEPLQRAVSVSEL